jgi:hypothetical protein
VIEDKQRSRSQKYSEMSESPKVRLSDALKAGSASSRKSLPSLRWWDDLEHDGLAHLATIQQHFRVSAFIIHSNLFLLSLLAVRKLTPVR